MHFFYLQTSSVASVEDTVPGDAGSGSVSIPACPTCPPTFVIGALTSQTLSSPMSPLMCPRMRLNERESALSKTLLGPRPSRRAT